MIVGILEADPALEQLRDRFGNYVSMFKELLDEGAEGSVLEYKVYDVQGGHLPLDLDECDGYIVTGSRASVYDDEEWIHHLEQLVIQLHQARKKIIGICFGHQLVAQALGGKTEPALVGWGVGVHTWTVTEAEEFMSPAAKQISLLVSHKDQVTKLPTDARLLATSDFCPNAMFQIDNHVLTFQGHPEFVKGYSRGLMDLREEIIGPQKYREGMASLQQSTDDKTVARWILRFINNQD